MENQLPSFSSSLLDAICHSIDLPLPPPTQLTLSNPNPINFKGCDKDTYTLMSAFDKWSAPVITTSKRYLLFPHESTNRRSFLPSSGFSSSDSEFAVSGSSSSCYSTKRPKPIRTSISADNAWTSEFRTFLQAQSSKKPCVSVKIPQHDGASAVKLRPTGKSYRDSKKAMRQLISPGGKLASFLNSIFNTKKARILVQSLPEPSDHSACSSTSLLLILPEREDPSLHYCLLIEEEVLREAFGEVLSRDLHPR